MAASSLAPSPFPSLFFFIPAVDPFFLIKLKVRAEMKTLPVTPLFDPSQKDYSFLGPPLSGV